MAEICFECYQKRCKYKCSKYDFILTSTPELCEGCGEYKPVILQRSNYFSDSRWFIIDCLRLFLRLFGAGICALFCFLKKRRKRKKNQSKKRRCK